MLFAFSSLLMTSKLSHFTPHSDGLDALRDEGHHFHLDRRNPRHTLTCRTCQLVQPFSEGPLNFGKIFDFEEDNSGGKDSQERHDDEATSSRPRARGRRGGRQRMKTRTTHCRRILHPHLVRVRRAQESSQLSPPTRIHRLR